MLLRAYSLRAEDEKSPNTAPCNYTQKQAAANWTYLRAAEAQWTSGLSIKRSRFPLKPLVWLQHDHIIDANESSN